MNSNINSELGAVQIHKKVIAEIISNVVDEVDGVSLVQNKVKKKLFKLFGKEKFSGIEIKNDDDNDVTLEIRVLVRYGLNIPFVARQIQDSIKSAIDKTVDINLKNININISGVERGLK